MKQVQLLLLLPPTLCGLWRRQIWCTPPDRRQHHDGIHHQQHPSPEQAIDAVIGAPGRMVQNPPANGFDRVVNKSGEQKISLCRLEYVVLIFIFEFKLLELTTFAATEIWVKYMKNHPCF